MNNNRFDRGDEQEQLVTRKAAATLRDLGPILDPVGRYNNDNTSEDAR